MQLLLLLLKKVVLVSNNKDSMLFCSHQLHLIESVCGLRCIYTSMLTALEAICVHCCLLYCIANDVYSQGMLRTLWAPQQY